MRVSAQRQVRVREDAGGVGWRRRHQQRVGDRRWRRCAYGRSHIQCICRRQDSSRGTGGNSSSSRRRCDTNHADADRSCSLGLMRRGLRRGSWQQLLEKGLCGELLGEARGGRRRCAQGGELLEGGEEEGVDLERSRKVLDRPRVLLRRHADETQQMVTCSPPRHRQRLCWAFSLGCCPQRKRQACQRTN